jgi:SPP1 gp7 family putative phage head morphogenesis protein
MRPFHIPSEITPQWFKAMTLQLEPDGEDDAEQQIRRQLERKFERELAGAFDEQLNTLLPDDASDDAIRSAPQSVTTSSEPVREVLRRNLESGAELGVSVAFDTLEQIGMAFDYTLAHATAARWASRYSYELVRGINSTTTARLQTAVNDWFRESTTVGDLITELAPTFGRKRAKTIAITETTRAAAEGSIAGYEQSGVVEEIEWVTMNDEKRCVTCKELNEKRAPLRGSFQISTGSYQAPAHPGCRCFVRPVIKEA